MPELPEVETTVRAISKFKNKILKEIVIHNRDLRWQVEHDVEKKPRNKYIHIDYYHFFIFILMPFKNTLYF